MDNPENFKDGHEIPAWMHVARREFELRSEVAFWRELIRDSDGAVPDEHMERMQHALALAENRLRQLYEEYAGRSG